MDESKKHEDVVTGGASTKKEPPKIKTRDQAVNYMQAALRLLQTKREACNVIIPDDTQATIRFQRRAERVFLMHVGRVLEAASLMCSVGLIEADAFETFHKDALNTMAPSVIGVGGIDLLRRRR